MTIIQCKFMAFDSVIRKVLSSEQAGSGTSKRTDGVFPEFCSNFSSSPFVLSKVQKLHVHMFNHRITEQFSVTYEHSKRRHRERLGVDRDIATRRKSAPEKSRNEIRTISQLRNAIERTDSERSARTLATKLRKWPERVRLPGAAHLEDDSSNSFSRSQGRTAETE